MANFNPKVVALCYSSHTVLSRWGWYREEETARPAGRLSHPGIIALYVPSPLLPNKCFAPCLGFMERSPRRQAGGPSPACPGAPRPPRLSAMSTRQQALRAREGNTVFSS